MVVVIQSGHRDLLVLASDAAQDRRTMALALVVDNAQNRLPDLARLLAGINTLPDTILLVVTDDRSGLSVVGTEALLESFSVVIGTLNKGLAGDVVLHVLLGRVEGPVVGTT